MVPLHFLYIPPNINDAFSVCILKNIRKFLQFMDFYWTGLLKGLQRQFRHHCYYTSPPPPLGEWNKKGRCGKSIRRRNVFAYLKIKKIVSFFLALVMSLFIALKTKQFKWSFRSFDISLKNTKIQKIRKKN